MGVEAREYRSPVHKLVRFFEKSRNQWKEKSVALRHQLKLAANQVRAVEKSRQQWREKAEQAIAAARAANAELEELRAAKKKNPVAELTVARAADHDQRIPGSSFLLGMATMAIRCVLQAAASLRCASRSIDLFFEMEYSQRLVAPSHVTIQNFILRLGLHELLRDQGRADDWIWLVDHTIQLGKTKCLLILGIRYRHWQELRRPLRHQDLQVLELQPVEQSNGSIVDRQLEHVAQRNGVPLQIVSDEGSDLRKGYESFLTRHPETLRSGDIAHQVATLLRHQLDKNESWNGFVAAAGICRAKLQQTGVGQWIPPTPKNKGRYMNIDELTGWAQKVLKLLCVARAGRLSESQREDFSVELLEQKLGWVESFATDLEDWTAMAEMGRQARQLMRTVGYGEHSETKLAAELPPATGPLAITFRAKLLEHVRQESSLVPPGERRLGSTEVLESLFGKGKRLEGQQSRSGFTRYVLALAASVVELTSDTVKEALSSVSIKQLQSWTKQHFSDTIQSKRRRDLPNSKKEQKQDKPFPLSIHSF